MELMAVDYQVIVNSVAVIITYAFPVFLIFEICSKVMSLFLDFVAGKKQVTLWWKNT